jgi:hypothetical protein
MVESIEQTLPGPATYVPEPFDGLPPIFGEDEPGQRRRFTRHRPTGSPRRRKSKDDADEPRDEDASVDAEPAVAPIPAPAPPVVVVPEPAPVPVALPPVVLVPEPAPVPVALPPVVLVPEPAPVPVPLPPVVLVPEPAPVPAPAPPPAAQSVPLPAPLPAQLPRSRRARSAAPKPPAHVASPRSVVRVADDPGLPSYVPEPFDPRDVANLAARVTAPTGIIYPAKRRRFGVLEALLLAAVLVTGFFTWRQLGKDSTTHSAAKTTVLYSSHAAHFAARFPNAPIELAEHKKLGSRSLTLHGAGDQSSKLLIESLDIWPGVPKSQIRAGLKAFGQIMARESSLTLKSQRPATFRGHPAQVGQFWTMDGTPFTVVVVFYSGRRCYLLGGPTGATFDALKKSFAPVA